MDGYDNSALPGNAFLRDCVMTSPTRLALLGTLLVLTCLLLTILHSPPAPEPGPPEGPPRDMAQLGGLAEPALREALEGKPSAEAKRRIEEVLQRLAEPVCDAATLRHIRAVEVLERIANADARTLLRELAAGAPGAPLTR